MFISFLIFFSIPFYAQDTKNDKTVRPPVIAITAIANFTYPKESHDIMAIRDKVKNTNQLADLQPQKSMTNPSFSIDSIERKENFGLVFSGFIKVPANDIYTFHL